MAWRRKKYCVGSKDLLLCCTELNQLVTCPVSPSDSGCSKDGHQLVRHSAAASSSAPGSVRHQHLQLQHTPANSGKEVPLDHLSCVRMSPRESGLMSILLMSGFSASVTSVEVMRHFAAVISTYKVRGKNWRLLQERKIIIAIRSIGFPNKTNFL